MIDANRFDSFLKENDKKAHDAIKKAEEETKKKQEKNHEIKRLTQQIQAVNSEMSKHRLVCTCATLSPKGCIL